MRLGTCLGTPGEAEEPSANSTKPELVLFVKGFVGPTIPNSDTFCRSVKTLAVRVNHFF
jgi:hypothetical protein